MKEQKANFEELLQIDQKAIEDKIVKINENANIYLNDITVNQQNKFKDIQVLQDELKQEQQSVLYKQKRTRYRSCFAFSDLLFYLNKCDFPVADSFAK